MLRRAHGHTEHGLGDGDGLILGGHHGGHPRAVRRAQNGAQIVRVLNAIQH